MSDALTRELAVLQATIDTLSSEIDIIYGALLSGCQEALIAPEIKLERTLAQCDSLQDSLNTAKESIASADVSNIPFLGKMELVNKHAELSPRVIALRYNTKQALEMALQFKSPMPSEAIDAEIN